ncbi:MAG: Mur ligase family protein [Planctomycetota bacterium]
MAKGREFRGKRITVVGLGHFGGGVAVARWLAGQGAVVTATDAKPAAALSDDVARLEEIGVTLRLGGHDASNFTQADLVVTSPALPPRHELLEAARDAGVRVTTEICLLVERLPTKLVLGVSGTKGKSTTASLLARMLGAWRPMPGERAEKVRARRSSLIDLTRDVPRRVWLGGNLGGSLLADLERITPDDFVVLELSSAMLHYLAELEWSPHVGLATMIGVDHLAWHGSEAAYHEAKGNLVRFQNESDFAVLPTTSPIARSLKDVTQATVVEYGKRAHLPEAFAPKLFGKHNRVNERGAYAAAALFGIYPDQAAEACTDFAGLPHRLSEVHVDDRGVRWVDDSIATIPEAAAAACRAFPKGTVLQIVGGSDKGLDPTPMLDTLADWCRVVLCIGDTGTMLADRLGDRAVVCHDLATAVATARRESRRGDTVLLSPGYASYDQFANFEERGQEFARLASEAAG